MGDTSIENLGQSSPASESNTAHGKGSRSPMVIYATSLHGCLRILELICTINALILSVLSTVWLRRSGGGFVTFIMITAFLFTAVNLVANLFTGQVVNVRWLFVEWIGYIIFSVVHIISFIVCIYSVRLVFIDYDSDGIAVVQDNANIIGVTIFVTFASLCYIAEAAIISCKKCRQQSNTGGN